MKLEILSDAECMARILEIPPTHREEAKAYIEEHMFYLFPAEPPAADIDYLSFESSAVVYHLPEGFDRKPGRVYLPQLAAAIILKGQSVGSYSIVSEQYRESFSFDGNDIHGHKYYEDEAEGKSDFLFHTGQMAGDLSERRDEILSFLREHPGAGTIFSAKLGGRFRPYAWVPAYLVLAIAVLVPLAIRHSDLAGEIASFRKEFLYLQQQIDSQGTEAVASNLGDLKSTLIQQQSLPARTIIQQIIEAGYPDIMITGISSGPGMVQFTIKGDNPLELQEELIQTGDFSQVQVGRIVTQTDGSKSYTLIISMDRSTDGTE